MPAAEWAVAARAPVSATSIVISTRRSTAGIAQPCPAMMIAAARSAIIIVGALVLPDVIVGITDASATRNLGRNV
jgi:CO dehydrogenase/acetyl-CoA synthase epsilon subunit